MTSLRLESVDVLGGSLSLPVAVAGSGDPLLFLHNAGGASVGAVPRLPRRTLYGVCTVLSG